MSFLCFYNTAYVLHNKSSRLYLSLKVKLTGIHWQFISCLYYYRISIFEKSFKKDLIVPRSYDSLRKIYKTKSIEMDTRVPMMKRMRKCSDTFENKIMTYLNIISMALRVLQKTNKCTLSLCHVIVNFSYEKTGSFLYIYFCCLLRYCVKLILIYFV